MRKNSRLPNLRNLGVHLRILLIVNLLIICVALLLSNRLAEFPPLLTALTTAVQPILLISMLSLFALNPLLSKLRYWQGSLIIVLLEVSITALVSSFLIHYFALDVLSDTLRACFFSIIVTLALLYYFYLQQHAYAPAIAEARLQVLQARIRPHFLFNSINAVLSLIRSQPRRAEEALEDLSDLFRVLMAENRDLVPIEDEIALSKRYLSIEQLRLEDRLRINWQIENMPPKALIPPLMLQPLIENAVYHGIEPLPEGGEILVEIYTRHKELHIHISNPYSQEAAHHHGNKMAIRNIKERLQLHFDLEAMLVSEFRDKQYHVHIRLPYEANYQGFST